MLGDVTVTVTMTLTAVCETRVDNFPSLCLHDCSLLQAVDMSKKQWNSYIAFFYIKQMLVTLKFQLLLVSNCANSLKSLVLKYRLTSI